MEDQFTMQATHKETEQRMELHGNEEIVLSAARALDASPEFSDVTVTKTSDTQVDFAAKATTTSTKKTSSKKK